ncbi:MAG: hypothetical protein ACTHLE_18685 [Agriterribacter sp.]
MPALAQQGVPASNIAVPASLPSSVDNKISNADKSVTRQTERHFNKLARQETKLLKKLAKRHSLAVSAFGNSKETYKQLSQKLNNTNGKADKLLKGKYLPGVSQHDLTFKAGYWNDE